MNAVDVMVLFLMAAADICLLVHLRRRRARYIRLDRMARSLQFHLRGAIESNSVVIPHRKWMAQRAS